MACIDAIFRSADSGRWEYHSNRVHLSRPRLQHAECHGNGHRIDDAHPDRRRILFERSFRYDDTLPAYGTQHGVLRSRRLPRVHAPPLMWSEGLDRIVSEPGEDRRRLAAAARDLGLGATAWQRLPECAGGLAKSGARRRPAAGSAGVRRLLARTSPIWMDSSTTSQCARDRSGGRRASRTRASDWIACIRAVYGTANPQVRGRRPDNYGATDRVHLVSSWLASLLAGTHAAIDPGDGSGMNLMDLAAKDWSPDASMRRPRTLPPNSPHRRVLVIVGTLASYWQHRYCFPAARVVAWSGDNPCSLVGTGLVREGVVAVSLGTSDTIFGIMPTASPSEDGTGPRVRLTDRRLHGHVGFQERIAGAGTGA